jgi:hypothetical protein
MCASRLLNRVEKNYSIIEKKALTMVFALHKFIHYLLGNKFVFYVDHTTLIYLVNKPHVLGRIVRWLLLFLKYDFRVVYKPCITHVVANALSRLPNSTKPTCVPDQTIDARLFYTTLEWLNDAIFFIKIGHNKGVLLVQQKQKLVTRA